MVRDSAKKFKLIKFEKEYVVDTECIIKMKRGNI